MTKTAAARVTRAVGITAVIAASAVAPLLTAPAAAADDGGCVRAWDTPDGGVTATNDCLSTTIGIGIDQLGFDAPCVAVDGMFINGHTHAEEVHWTKELANTAHAVDVYRCW